MEERGIMKIRTFALTLIITAALWCLAMPILTGCGQKQVSDSNTANVENSIADKGEKGLPSQTDSAYASMEEIKSAVVKILGDNYWPDKQLTEE